MIEQLVVAWIALGISLVSLSLGLYALHRLNSDSDVGELARHVAQLRKANRAEQMRRVREEAGEARAASAPLGKDGKPFPFGPLAMPGSEHFPQNTKAALRARVFGTRPLPPYKPASGNGGTP
jgi:hypothetical protein